MIEESPYASGRYKSGVSFALHYSVSQCSE